MTHRAVRTAPVILAGVFALAACQTAPQADAGFLQSYDGMQTQPGTLRVSVRDRRDDASAQGVERVYVEPAVLTAGAAEGIEPNDVALVLGEVDRQVCYELSERFTVLSQPATDAARVRAAVTRIVATGVAGSGASAVANYFIPGPLGIRVPGSTGTLAAEAELISVDGRQVAALAFARSANVIGTDTPSLSAVGDALQFAEFFGDQVGDSFSPEGRRVRAIADPDPCVRFGPRDQPGGFLLRSVTGVYVPQAQGVRPQKPQ